MQPCFAGYCISKIVDIIKAWINRKKPTYDEEKFDRLAKAFIQHKKRSKQQIGELKAEIQKDDSELLSGDEQPTDEKPIAKSIEIKPQHPKRQTKASSGKMENMLKHH